MSGAQDANMDPDVRISRDGLFNTGEDSNGYLLRYESPTRTFWFECYVEFIENVYDVVVGKIGMRNRHDIGGFSFSREEYTHVRRNIELHIKTNGIFSPDDPLSKGRVRQVTFS
jgi:hypothetical protein